MSGALLDDRRRAVEDAFFARENERLRLELRKAVVADETKRERIATSSGISDGLVLDQLAAMPVDADMAAVVALVPLVLVAWADGEISEVERAAILKAVEQAGITRGSPAYRLVGGWLKERPGPDKLRQWKDYVSDLMNTAGPEGRATLKHEIIGRARIVAEAAGGFLGFGTVSPQERAVLAELEQAFEAPEPVG